jgi:hypothetical protein
MQNVYLFPYTWDEIRLIVELEDNRVWTFARLEENRNKNEPGPIVDDSQEDYKASVAVRKRHFLSHIYINAIILPRQARDKHRENSIKCRFVTGEKTHTFPT